MKRALIYTSVASMIDQFNRENINILHQNGFQVDIACNFIEGNTINRKRIENFKNDMDSMGVRMFNIPIPRSLNSISNLFKSYQLTRNIFKNNKYDLIHFQSPIGAAIGRLAKFAIVPKTTKIIYTAHGFHFYKGAPVFNWIIFYPLELLLSKTTDILITINKEDYKRAKYMFSQKVYYIPGVGINTNQSLINKNMIKCIRNRIGVSQNELLLVSVGELNENKNHEKIIKNLDVLDKPFKYVICGQGILTEHLKDLAKSLKLEEQIKFLGYRDDIYEILSASDIFCFPSKREGLSVSLMEAMSFGLPCIVSNIRGNSDLIEDNSGGFLFNLHDSSKLRSRLKFLSDSEDLRRRQGKFNRKKIKQFDKLIINKKMQKIYTDSL